MDKKVKSEVGYDIPTDPNKSIDEQIAEETEHDFQRDALAVKLLKAASSVRHNRNQLGLRIIIIDGDNVTLNQLTNVCMA